nr:integrase, catalytic region, zinc finger, CCHC-type, peptidase aspartic, catalytic [Tanacetum cinerariifolium]
KPKRVKDFAYHKEKMLLCKQAKKEDMDEEIDEQELEAHYSYMEKIQETEFEKYKAFNDRIIDYDKLKRKYVETKFDKPSVVRQPNAQRIPKPSVLGKPSPFSDSLERRYFSKTKSVPKTNVLEGKGKYVETKFDKPSVVRQPNAQRIPKPSVLGVNHKTNVSRPHHRSNKLKDKVVPNSSQVKLKNPQVEEHPRISSISNKIKYVTACNDSLNFRTSNVNAVCATCKKCLVDSDHFACVTKMLNDVNARTKKPNVVPISTRKPKAHVNKSVATPHKKKVASKSTNQKQKSYYRMLYEKTRKAWKWWIEQQCPLEYKWVPNTKMQWVPKAKNENVQKRIVQLILFIVDSGCTKHMTRNLKLLCNFIEKFMGTVRFGNDQFAPILGYGDLVQGNITINMVYYVEGLNHNLFLVGQFCDADLEVAFRKSTCFVRDLQGYNLLTGNHGFDLYRISLQELTSSTPLCLMAKASPTQAWLWHRRLSHLNFDYINLLSKKDVVIGLLKLKYGNDLLTGNRGSDLYTISLQESTSSTPLCLMAKASPTQAWLWHRRLSHLNFDYINLLSKKDVVIGLQNLKYVKDQLCSSYEVSKAKRSSFKSKAVPSLKVRLNLLHIDLCGPMRVASINGKKYILVIVDDYSKYTWTLFLHAHVPSQQELDLLFGPLYDEFFNACSNPQDTQATMNIQATSAPSTPSYVHVEENNNNRVEEQHLPDDEFTNPFCAPAHKVTESSSYNIGNSNIPTFNQPQVSKYRWTKDHPLEQVHGNPSRSVQIRQQLATDPKICMFALIVSTAEPKNIKEAMADSAWIEVMQEEIHQFNRLQVWKLVDKSFGKSVIRLKWLWKDKKDEHQNVIRNKARLVAKGTQVFSNLSDGRENDISQWSTKGGDAHVPSQQELDLLFGPLYDEFFNACSNPQDTQATMNIQATSAPSTPSYVYVEENNNNRVEEEHLPDDEFTNPFCAPAHKVAESSSYNIGNSNIPTFNQPQVSKYRWTKDHPLEQVHGNPSRCIDTRKSTSGGIQFLGDKLVSWMSRKQNCTAMSSAEAEYVVLSASCAQVMWIRTQLQDYGFNYSKILLYWDSQSAIAISCNPLQHSRTKHIHTRQIGMSCLTPAELEVLAK